MASEGWWINWMVIACNLRMKEWKRYILLNKTAEVEWPFQTALVWGHFYVSYVCIPNLYFPYRNQNKWRWFFMYIHEVSVKSPPLTLVNVHFLCLKRQRLMQCFKLCFVYFCAYLFMHILYSHIYHI